MKKKGKSVYAKPEVRVMATDVEYARLLPSTANNEVDTREKVSAAQINGIRVRFIPETHFRRGVSGGSAGKRLATRALTDMNVDWEEWRETTSTLVMP